MFSSKSLQSCLEDVQRRRASMEQARQSNVRRVQSDLRRIAKREWTYAQTLAKEVIPVQIAWKEDAWERLEALLPFKVTKVAATEAESSTNSRDEPTRDGQGGTFF